MKISHTFTLALAALAVFLIHCLTVVDYPAAWFDEIEILEMGRFSIFDVSNAWSVNLLAQDGAFAFPAPYFHYLSGAVLEGLYRLTGTHVAGRLAMLLSLPVCALVLFQWLAALGVSRGIAFLVAALFLVDPNATICAHWYRPDVWCIALMLTAHLLIIRSRAPRQGGFACAHGACASGAYARMDACALILAGALAVVSLCFWLSSVVLLPLLAVEVLSPVVRRPPAHASPALKRLLRETLLLSLGALVALAIFLIPLYGKLPAVLAQYIQHSEVGSVLSTGPSFGAKVAANAVAFVKIALRSPFSWLLALVGLVAARRLRLQILAFVLVAGFMVATRVYHLRMAYLLPWIYLLAALALERLLACDRLRGIQGGGDVPIASRKARCVRLAARGLVALALAFGLGVSVVALTYAAWPAGNTLAAFVPRLRAAVPGRHPKVWLVDFEHECYYAGRRLGWRMFSTQPSMGHGESPALAEPYAAALDGMDAVVATVPVSKEGEATLVRHGFRKAARVDLPSAEKGRIKSLLAGLVYAHGYPSADVWLRNPAKAMK